MECSRCFFFWRDGMGGTCRSTMIKQVWEVKFIERDVWKGRRIMDVDHGVDCFMLEMVVSCWCSIELRVVLSLWMDCFVVSCGLGSCIVCNFRCLSWWLMWWWWVFEWCIRLSCCLDTDGLSREFVQAPFLVVFGD